MKRYLSIFIFSLFLGHLAFSSSTAYLPIIDYESTPLTFVLELKPLNDKRAIVLDCQSFFHELRIYKDKNIHFENILDVVLLYENECNSIFDLVITNVDKGEGICIIFDRLDFNLSVYSDLGSCEHD